MSTPFRTKKQAKESAKRHQQILDEMKRRAAKKSQGAARGT